MNAVNRNASYSSFASMLIRCEPKPQRGLTLVLRSVEATKGRAASHSYGWYGMQRGMHAFRYATANNIAYLRHAILYHAHYQPYEWLAARPKGTLRHFEEPMSDAYGIASETSVKIRE